jgi:hypothetical protein
MKIRYSSTVGVVLVLLGALNTGLSLAAGTSSPALITGPIVFLGGILFFTRTYFRILDDRIEVPALLGPLKRTLPFARPADVTIEGGALYVVTEGRKKKVASRWMANAADWDAALSKLGRG